MPTPLRFPGRGRTNDSSVLRGTVCCKISHSSASPSTTPTSAPYPRANTGNPSRSCSKNRRSNQGTIRENIAIGLETPHEDNPDDAIPSARRQENAYEFISSLLDGLSTLCGRAGLSLSSGYRRRIAVARALIRNPLVLLLGEATSTLDTISERMVQRALVEAAAQGDRFTIAVAHRLSTIKDADVIFVFMGGAVVEVGSYVQPVQRRGVDWEMRNAQALDQ